MLIRRDGQIAMTPSDQGGTIVYAAGKAHHVTEGFDAVRSYFGADPL